MLLLSFRRILAKVTCACYVTLPQTVDRPLTFTQFTSLRIPSLPKAAGIILNWTCTRVCITQYGYVHGSEFTLQSYSTGRELHKLHSTYVLHKWYGFTTQSYSTGIVLHAINQLLHCNNHISVPNTSSSPHINCQLSRGHDNHLLHMCFLSIC